MSTFIVSQALIHCSAALRVTFHVRLTNLFSRTLIMLFLQVRKYATNSCYVKWPIFYYHHHNIYDGLRLDTIPGIYNFIFKIQPYYAILVLEPFPLPLHNPNHPFAIHLAKMFLILFKKKKTSADGSGDPEPPFRFFSYSI